jgi:hypothetical protein
MTNSRKTVRTIYSPDRRRRVIIFYRADGTYGFEHEHYSSEPREQCWIYGLKQSETRCPTEQIALRECISRVDWLAECIATGVESDGLPRAQVTGPPPAEISGMRVVCFTPIDRRHRHTGACRQIVAGEVQGPAEGLIICRDDQGKAFYLFGCDANWNPVTDTWHQTLGEAQRQAELEYTGVSITWQFTLPPSVD